MEKTLYTINIDYNKTLEQANKLDNAAQIISKEIKELQNIRNNISASWSGENAVNYLNKVRAAEEELEKTKNKVIKSAESIRKVAKEVYNAEKAAIEVANTKGSMGGR